MSGKRLTRGGTALFLVMTILALACGTYISFEIGVCTFLVLIIVGGIEVSERIIDMLAEITEEVDE